MLPTVLYFRKKRPEDDSPRILVVSIVVFLLDPAIWFFAM